MGFRIYTIDVDEMAPSLQCIIMSACSAWLMHVVLESLSIFNTTPYSRKFSPRDKISPILPFCSLWWKFCPMHKIFCANAIFWLYLFNITLFWCTCTCHTYIHALYDIVCMCIGCAGLPGLLHECKWCQSSQFNNLAAGVLSQGTFNTIKIVIFDARILHAYTSIRLFLLHPQ